MQRQSHTSPDGLLTLTSEPTRTINADHPEGFDDWIITIEPGDMHTHPDLLAPSDSSELAKAEAAQRFIDDILQDRTILIIRSVSNQITEVSWVDAHTQTLESAVHEAKNDSHRDPNSPEHRIVFRLWSGTVFATV